MERKDVLQEPAYWITQIQIALYDCATRFMFETGKNKTELAQHLGVSKGYVSQLLSGDYNFSITKLVETAMLMGYVPQMNFKSMDEILLQDIERFQFDNIHLNIFAKDRRMFVLTTPDAAKIIEVLRQKEWI